MSAGVTRYPRDRRGIAREERRLLDPPDGPGPNGLPVQRRRPAVADQELAKHRLVDAPEDRLPLMQEGDQGAEERDGRGE